MTLSDLAKYSMTRSIARLLCDSRATCFYQNKNIIHINSEFVKETEKVFITSDDTL